MTPEDLTDDQSELVSQFEGITGLGPEEENDNIAKLLRINDWNLNNAISNYFDTKFDSVASHAASSGFEAIDNDENDAHLSHRNHAQQDNFMNLQNQFALDSLLPKLPKAPKTSNNWQLDVGIHSSMKDSCKDPGAKIAEPKRTPMLSLWVLWIIPKTILQLIMTLIRSVFRISNNKVASNNRFPREFDYEYYAEEASFLDWFARELADGDQDQEKSEYDEKYDDVVEKVEEVGKREPSVLDDFNVSEDGFNGIHGKTQNSYSWLLVLLVNNNRSSQKFLQNIFESEHFNKLFNKNSGLFKETLIYTNNVETDPESFEVGQTYKVKKLPYVMLIGNVSNNPSILSSMSVVYKSNIAQAFISDGGLHGTAAKILRNLHKLMDNFNPQLITQRIDKQEIELSRQLKQQQDDAYTESLEKDRLKKMQKENEIKSRQNLQELVKLRESFLFHLIRSNWFEQLNETAAAKSKISVKLPNGKRIIETILKSIAVNDLYLFVELKLFVNDLINSSLTEFQNEDDVLSYISSLNVTDAIAIEDYLARFPFKFELIQPFPKKIFSPTTNAVESIPELKTGASLLVEYIREDDDQEDDDDDE